MAKMKLITCSCGCGRQKKVRLSDIKRGWGKYYSKSCKARAQERKTGQYRAYRQGIGVSHAAKLRGESENAALYKYAQKVRTIDGVIVNDCDMRITDQEWDDICTSAELGWDGHKG